MGLSYHPHKWDLIFNDASLFTVTVSCWLMGTSCVWETKHNSYKWYAIIYWDNPCISLKCPDVPRAKSRYGSVFRRWCCPWCWYLNEKTCCAECCPWCWHILIISCGALSPYMLLKHLQPSNVLHSANAIIEKIFLYYFVLFHLLNYFSYEHHSCLVVR